MCVCFVVTIINSVGHTLIVTNDVYEYIENQLFRAFVKLQKRTNISFIIHTYMCLSVRPYGAARLLPEGFL
jgi:hypothetical protein